MEDKKQYFDVLVVVPLEEELREFMQIFPSVENFSSSTEFLHSVDCGNPNIKILVAQQEDMGKNSATLTTDKLLDKYDIGLVVCLGIAGSLSNDMRVGDVCYSGTIIDVYDNTKAIDLTDGSLDIELSPTQYTTLRAITSAVNFIRTQPELTALYNAWQNERSIEAARLVPEPITHRENKCEKIGKPESKNGTIVCGAVSKSEIYNKKLHNLDRKILAIETESGGVFSQAQRRNIPALTVRGISDYADDNKTELEKSSKGNVRHLAAANAASFLKLQFGNRYFIDALNELKKGQQQELKLTATQPKEQDIAKILRNLGQAIDEKLRELSPEFRLQPKGYRLPIPRIKQIKYQDGLGKSTPRLPKEIRDVIQDRNMPLINLPRTYPDQSLAWIIADDLATLEIEGKQPLPIVINGDSIKPPKSTFETISQQPLAEYSALPSAQLVIIVENVPLNSKTRLNYLIEQIKLYENAKFVFITRGDVNLVFESEFSKQLPIDVYDVCKISFVEISHFIQKNFSMTGAESEVIALRLRDTFNKFDLAAHPTYFAGIPKETLSALLHANRRAELIQLAVDGFLTFIVAGDKSDVNLSRTTRSRFLRRLVAAMEIEKKNFNHEEIIKFTADFSKEYDFEIDPIAFVQGFIEQGILHWEGENLRFSLPFIKSYLLAVELKNSANLATKYFDLNNTDFDFATFDLYAEIGADDIIVKKVIEQLQRCIEEYKHISEREHILLTNDIQPTMLHKPESLSSLQDRLAKATEDIQKGQSDNVQKQKLLDIADRVRETTARKARNADDNEAQEAHEVKRLGATVQNWVIATLLLGSGAEHLDAQTKRHLASNLISLACLVLDEWTRFHANINFEEVKAELTSEENVKSLDDATRTKSDLEETRKLIVNLVDILEYTVIAQPFMRISNLLCEQARHKVLATSVENSTVTTLMERLIRSTWLTDIDSKRGKDELNSSMKELPTASFLRITLASHYLTRVYWNHWKSEDRLILLDAATDAIKPLSIGINKASLKRIIEKKELGEEKLEDSL